MKHKIYQIFAVCCALLMSHAAFASYISDSLSVDEDSNTVTAVGLEWLQWDLTDDMTIDEALAKYSSEGWRLATTEEMTALLTGFADSNSDNVGSTADIKSISQDVANEILDAFGVTYSNDDNGFSMSSILYGDDSTVDDYLTAQIKSDSWASEIGTYDYNTASNQTSIVTAIALVRDITTPSTDVPEPGMLLIFAMGCLLLVGRNHYLKKQQQKTTHLMAN